MSTPIKNSNIVKIYLEPLKSLGSLFALSINMDYPKDYSKYE